MLLEHNYPREASDLVATALHATHICSTACNAHPLPAGLHAASANLSFCGGTCTLVRLVMSAAIFYIAGVTLRRRRLAHSLLCPAGSCQVAGRQPLS